MMLRRCSALLLAGAAVALTGCAPPAPTSDELVAEAEQHYLDYRTVTNDVQALIDDGPWHAEVSAYGMQPSGAGCSAGSYKFDLTRTTEVDAAQHAALRREVLEYLTGAGYEVEGQLLGSGASASTDVIVREQADFSLLMVTFIENGSVLLSATTKCWPGDRHDLSRAIFGGVTLGDGYLPREEAPSDPLFFGITPGAPDFGPTSSLKPE